MKVRRDDFLDFWFSDYSDSFALQAELACSYQEKLAARTGCSGLTESVVVT